MLDFSIIMYICSICNSMQVLNLKFGLNFICPKLKGGYVSSDFEWRIVFFDFLKHLKQVQKINNIYKFSPFFEWVLM